MGKYFQLFNMVDLRDQETEIASLRPQERQARIDALANSTKLIGIYSPEAFDVDFRGEIVTIKAGWNEYAPMFAVWALQKYGKGSTYGPTFRTAADGKTLIANPVVSDEPPAGEEKKIRKAEEK